MNTNPSEMDLNVPLIKTVLTLYNEMLNNGISIVYLGAFTHEVTKIFTSMQESEMDRNAEEKSIRRKVYHTMIETLQNLNKHSDELSDKNSIGKGLFMVGKKGNLYYIITANKVSNTKMGNLKQSIEQVNMSSKEELKEMHKKQLLQGKLSAKGGAGLGLIDIARKTDQKLQYEFLPVDADNSFFIFQIEIDALKFDEIC